MKEVIKKDQGFDVIIVVVSIGNKEYWERRLEASRNEILSQKTKIIVIEEDWPGGAGQLLGTLHAFQKANELGDLKATLEQKGTLAIYHAAGYGKRMAPLCGTEVNNKPGVKLPKIIKIGERESLLRVLEAVIFSTQIFAKSREGRICVFWGDQVFLPSRAFKLETKLPVEILGVKKRVFLSKKDWQKDWQQYGVLIPTKKRGILMREKISWQKFQRFLEKGYLQKDREEKVTLFKSLGCFSISLPFLETLFEEFFKEIELKRRNLGTDFYLWVPLTSRKREYQAEGGSGIYWERIKKIRRNFIQKTGKKRIIGEKNLGEKTFWWDYGNLKSYFLNLLKLLKKTDEGEAARKFFEAEKYLIKRKFTKGLKIKNSILINSEIGGGKIENVILVDSKILWAKIKNGVIISTQAKGVFTQRGKLVRNILLYNVKEERNVKTLPAEVVTDIIPGEGTKIRMRTSLLRDGKRDWQVRLPKNIFAYSEIERLLARIANATIRFRT
ncbi:MAG: hypothetical protein QME57_02630 [Patescibacteria group bacterium]|nr:hypothetical protein [Patescibacteria group bacterium]